MQCCPGCECLCSGRVWNQRTVWVGSCEAWCWLHMSVWGLAREPEPVQKSIMSFTQIKLLHSSPLLTPIREIIRKSNVRKMSHFATKHSSSMMRYDHDDDWVFWDLRTMRLVLWCNPWSCEPSESYGNIMRAKWPSPNMPWSDPNFNTALIKFERKTDCCRASEIGLGTSYLCSKELQ